MPTTLPPGARPCDVIGATPASAVGRYQRRRGVLRVPPTVVDDCGLSQGRPVNETRIAWSRPVDDPQLGDNPVQLGVNCADDVPLVTRFRQVYCENRASHGVVTEDGRCCLPQLPVRMVCQNLSEWPGDLLTRNPGYRRIVGRRLRGVLRRGEASDRAHRGFPA